MKQIVFTPKIENGEPAVRKPKLDEYADSAGNIVQVTCLAAWGIASIYTRSEVELPDPEPIGWKFVKIGRGHAKKGDFVKYEDDIEKWREDSQSAFLQDILSCTPIFEEDK